MHREGGTSRFEFAICIILVAILAGALLERLLTWREQSERAAAYYVVGALRTALAAKAVQIGARQGEAALLRLLQENPMTWLSRKPANYLGEYYSPDLKSLPRGAWFFDRTDKTVNYLFGRDTFPLRTSNLLKFKVELSRSTHSASIDGRGGNPGALVIDEIVTSPNN